MRNLAFAAFVMCAGFASAQVPGFLLDNSNDGSDAAVSDLLSGTPGDQVYADVVADQFSDRLFDGTVGKVTFNSLYSIAGLNGKHRLGWYQPGNSSSINWFLGDVKQNGLDQITSATITIGGVFGLALDNGAGDIFYSEKSLNPSNILSSPVPLINGFDTRDQVSGFFNQGFDGGLILSWEDLRNQTAEPGTGLLDYNDYGVLVRNAAPVPEPGLMLAAGAGLAALAARRRKKA